MARQPNQFPLAVLLVIGLVALVAVIAIIKPGLTPINGTDTDENAAGLATKPNCDLMASQQNGQTLTYTVNGRQLIITTLIQGTTATFTLNGQPGAPASTRQTTVFPDGTTITVLNIAGTRPKVRFCLKLSTTQPPTCTACTQNTCTTSGQLQTCINGCLTAPVSCTPGTTCQAGQCTTPPSTADIVGWYGEGFDPQSQFVTLTRDRALRGWAMDRNNPSLSLRVRVYLDGPAENGGTFAGEADASVLYYLSESLIAQGLPEYGRYGFTFYFPDALLDGRTRSLFIYAIDGVGVSHQIPHPGTKVTLTPREAGSHLPVFRTTNACFGTNCPTTSQGPFTFGAPWFPEPEGWASEENFFNKWECTSTTGINEIRRLNIAPRAGGHSSTQWNKDSLFVNWKDLSPWNEPEIYFATRTVDFASQFQIKKTHYDHNAQQWKIFDVIDHPSCSGGIGMAVGTGTDFLLNDYCALGWGPTANKPGNDPTGKIPGVSNTATSSEIQSYPLVGTGQYGLTTIQKTRQPNNAILHYKYCIHNNPILADYDENGIPRLMLAYLMSDQKGTEERVGCTLPTGQYIPGGMYLYRYQDSLGWQLDLSAGMLDPSTDRTEAVQLIPGERTKFIFATWEGKVKTVDASQPSPRTPTEILTCQHPYFMGSATGYPHMFYFVAIPPEQVPRFLSGQEILEQDIYYAWRNPALG